MSVDLEKLRQDVDLLMQRRLTQVDYTSGSVKQRSMGEANLWVNGGVSTSRPAQPPKTSQGTAIWFSTDTNVLSIWNGVAWKNTTLT